MIFRPKPTPEQQVHDYLDGTLSGEALAAFNDRTQKDPALRKIMEEFGRVKHTLSLLPFHPTPRDFTLKPEMVGVRPPQQKISLILRRSSLVFAMLFFSVFVYDGFQQYQFSSQLPSMAISMEQAAPAVESMPMALEAPMAAAPAEADTLPPEEPMAKSLPIETLIAPEARSIAAPDGVVEDVVAFEPAPIPFVDFFALNRVSFYLVSLAVPLFLLIAYFSVQKKQELEWRKKYAMGKKG
jgi:hypothetical protein